MTSVPQSESDAVRVKAFANRQTAKQCRKLADQLLFLQDLGVAVDPAEIQLLKRMSKRFFRRVQRSTRSANG